MGTDARPSWVGSTLALTRDTKTVATLLLNSIALDPNRWTATKEPFFKLADLLPRIARAGFGEMEIWHHHLSWLADTEFADLRAVAKDLGVTFPIAGVYPAFHLEGAEAEREWESLALVVERSATIGAKHVKIFAGAIGSALADAAGARDRSMVFAGRFLDLVESHGMGLNVETHPDTLTDSVVATLSFLAAFPGADMGVCFQPFDFGSTEQTVADFRVLREHVRHVHLQGRRNDQMSLIAEADIDYSLVFKAFADANFDGALSIEFVKDCVVAHPEDMSVEMVLANAVRDREHVLRLAAAAGLHITDG